MNTDREWLLIKSEQEDGCMVSVGGLTHELEENQNNNIFDRWTLGKASKKPPVLSLLQHGDRGDSEGA